MRVAVVDTTFAPVDMAGPAMKVLREEGGFQVTRTTVPGIKDLPVAVKNLLRSEGCGMGLVFGTPGPKMEDKLSAHVASMGLMQVQLQTDTPVLEVFVHLDEAERPGELHDLCVGRAVEHARNAIKMHQGTLGREAGTGQRQGGADVGPLNETPGWTPLPGRAADAVGDAGARGGASGSAGKH